MLELTVPRGNDGVGGRPVGVRAFRAALDSRGNTPARVASVIGPITMPMTVVPTAVREQRDVMADSALPGQVDRYSLRNSLSKRSAPPPAR